jgi:DNA polymerase-1
VIETDPDFHLVESWEEAQAFMTWLGERRPVLAVDTETSGLNWWDGRLRLAQFGDAESGWCLPFGDWTGLVREVLEGYRGQMTFHNAKFDLHWLERADITVPHHLVDDTMVMAHLLAPTSRVGLKDTAARLIDHRSAHGQSDLKKAMGKAGWTWDTVPVDFEGYWVYSALDPVLTARLWELMAPQVKEGSFRHVYDLEMRCIRILLDMEERGANVDLAYCGEQKQALEDYATEGRDWLKDNFDCLPTGPKLAAALLTQGVKLRKKTASGGWCTDAEVMESIDHPLAQTALRIRQAEKLAHSYFGNFLELNEDGVIHPDVRSLGAVTGRMSVSRPSMQNLPTGRKVRDAFIARPDHTLLGVDYEQVEMRLAAHFSEDPGLIEAFLSGGDFFVAMAQSIFADPTIDKADPRRSITKSSMYAKVYGSGVRKFADTAGISEAEARTFMSKLDTTFPGLRRLSNQVQNAANKRMQIEGTAYVTTTAGRRLVVDDADKVYKLVNALIQGTAADLLKQVMVELDDSGVAQYLMMAVHDELLFDIPDEDLDEVTETVVSVMTRDEYRVPLDVDPHHGKRWGDLK